MNVSYRLKVWLRFFRAHTVILEAPMAVIGAALAIGTIYDYRVGLWLIFGVLYHLVGYGMNSYVDWKDGFDKDDPKKQHHPLNTGDISHNTAKNVIYAMTFLLLFYILLLTLGDPIAIGLAILMVASGISYNYFGKYTSLKAIPISISHTMVFFIPYYLYSDQIDVFAVLITGAYFIHHIYQISISGDIKDIDQDEASLIQKLGAELYEKEYPDIDYFSATESVIILSYTLTVAQIAIVSGAVYYIGASSAALVFISVTAGLLIYETDSMLTSGSFDRTQRLKHISRREFFGYSMIHAVSIIVISWSSFIIIITSMIVYLGLVSKFIWGNWLVPEV